MRRVFIIASGVIAGLLLDQPGCSRRPRPRRRTCPRLPYDSVPNFLKFPPNIYLGEGIGVATNSKGHVFVYTRSGDTRLFEFDQNGAYVREIGAGLYGFTFAHAVRVDKDDNIWTVDEGSNMVIKFNPAGRVVMVIGRRPEAGRRAGGDDRPGHRRRTRTSRTRSAVRPTSAGTRRATSSSPTATATIAS